MSQTQSPESIWELHSRLQHIRTHRWFLILQVLSVAAAIPVIIWVIQKPMSPVGTRSPGEGDLAFALMPILAAAIGINLFIEMGVSFFEQYDPTLIAYLGWGQRWLIQAQSEVSLARQFQMDAYERYSDQLEGIDKITK